MMRLRARGTLRQEGRSRRALHPAVHWSDRTKRWRPWDRTMRVQPVTPSDLLAAADHCAAALSPVSSVDWATPVPGLSWDVRTTVEHLVDVLGFYTLHLVAASRERLRVDVRCHDGVPNDEVIHILDVEAKGLATVARLLDSDTRVFHFHGTTDVPGILALACSELLVHGNDAARGLGSTLAPSPDVAARTLERLFPSAPQDTDPWLTLLWATGRDSLAGHADQGPNWIYRVAPPS